MAKVLYIVYINTTLILFLFILTVIKLAKRFFCFMIQHKKNFKKEFITQYLRDTVSQYFLILIING